MNRNYAQDPFKNLLSQLNKTIAEATKNHFFATVTSVSQNGVGLSIDGDTSGTKKYTCNRNIRLSVGDRVLVAKESGTYIVICRIGSPSGLVAKTSEMTQQVGVDDNGALWTALPVASSTTLGGVKPIAKTTAMTQKVGVDDNGALWTNPASLSVASSTTLGGVKPVAKTSDMTQQVGVDSNGALWTTPPSESKVNALYTSTTSATADNLTLSSTGVLTPSKFSQYGSNSTMGLGSNSAWFGNCYLGGYGSLYLCNDSTSSKIGFFGTTPQTRQTLSLTSNNMGYTSVTASNYLYVLNNLVGILKSKYGLIK